MFCMNKALKIFLSIGIVCICTLSVFMCLLFNNINSSECYIGNYDAYICYNGEIYYKISDENKALFSDEFYNIYDENAVMNLTDLEDRTKVVRGINPDIRFLTEKVTIVYNNSAYDEIAFLKLDHFLESYDYAKRS